MASGLAIWQSKNQSISIPLGAVNVANVDLCMMIVLALSFTLLDDLEFIFISTYEGCF